MINDDEAGLLKAMDQEERQERVEDMEYWKPLRKELEILCHRAIKPPK